MSTTNTHPTGFGPEFGANQWLVEEMYEKYLADPGSVDPAWHEFFRDFRLESHPDGTTSSRIPFASNGQAFTPLAAAASSVTADSPEKQNAAAPPRAQTASPSTTSPAGHHSSANGRPPVTTSTSTPTNSKPTNSSNPASAPAAPAESRPAAESQPAEPKPAESKPAEAKPAAKKPAGPAPGADAEVSVLRGAAARVVSNMDASLAIPTATSVRAVPAKLLADNRIVINNHLRRSRGGKVSFTHLIGYALVKALLVHPEMNRSFTVVDGKPTLVSPQHINLGLAIDLQKNDGSRALVVAAIKGCETMDFLQFWAAYEEIIRKARNNKLTADDFSGVTVTLTNPGGLGTVHSMPRLMPGQGTIIGVGAMEYPAEFQGMNEETLSQQAISKIITLTSTYDHRVIQGAQSGEFLRAMHQMLLADDFYDELFQSLRIPYEPVRWTQDLSTSHEGQIGKAARVIELINAYRTNGHLMADTDPLEFKVRSHPDLDVLKHGLTLWDLDREFPVGGFAGERMMTLREVLGVLRDSYCRRVGVEYMHITDPEERVWLQNHIEVKQEQVDTTEQKHILGRLNVAEAFETFLQTKYVGQKRFSLEGAETLIALLDAVLSQAAATRLDEAVVGMAHRGRLNVLANIVGKSYGQIFREFAGNLDPANTHGSGDVKYHLGARGTFTGRNGEKIPVSLTSNPSHLEAVDPVLEGIVRAKQDMIDKGESGFTVLPVLIHGDAAFAGQGVVAETLNLSLLRGYRTGGTVHVVVNNQVGFTTSPVAARSSLYSTDVARMIQAPIFHVNGDDPEACVRVAKLAVDFRQEFKKDVVIDMVCYRRRGHNEGDDPSVTQPKMYDVIDSKRSVRKLYTEALIGRGDISIADAEEALKDYHDQLEKVFVETRDATGSPKPEPIMVETPAETVPTAIPAETLKLIGDSYVSLPEGFTVHPRLKRILERRAAMASEGGVDWGFGELLAFGSILMEGIPVRLSGQDSRRGTFAQRHAVLVDRRTGEEYVPLRNLDPEQARFWAFDSLLSEFAAMGFEYGYSITNRKALVLWEAQYGDFANGAQSVVDEFISAGEAKWGQRSRLVLLLPHGYEGGGPDHSTGRIERFLQLCAEDNMTIANCTTPANYFHLLRRQAMGHTHRPLVVFTPKSLLRSKLATSGVEDFTTGAFAPVLPEPKGLDPAGVRRVLLCAGKIYYDLVAARDAAGADDTAILRVEQLYPIPGDALSQALAPYSGAQELIWVQEEPANQGPWPFMALNLPGRLQLRTPLRGVSRRPSASPAAGSSKVHEQEQRAIIAQLFDRA